MASVGGWWEGDGREEDGQEGDGWWEGRHMGERGEGRGGKEGGTRKLMNSVYMVLITTTQHYTTQHYTTQHYTTQHYTTQHYTTQHYRYIGV